MVKKAISSLKTFFVTILVNERESTMISTPGFNSRKPEKLEESTKEGRRGNIQLPENRRKQLIRCDFCDSVAVKVATRRDGKIVYFCEECVPLINKEETEWSVGSIIQR